MKSSRNIVTFVICCLATASSGCLVGEGYGAGISAEEAEGVLYVYSRPSCNACRMAKPIVDRLIKEGFNIKVIDVERSPQKAGKAGVAFLPTFIHYADGKETKRIKGTASERELRRMFRPQRR